MVFMDLSHLIHFYIFITEVGNKFLLTRVNLLYSCDVLEYEMFYILVRNKRL